MPRCKECGGQLVKKISKKTGDLFLVCEDCGKKYKLKQHTEEPVKKEEPIEEPIPAPVVEEPIIKESAPAPIEEEAAPVVEEPVEEPAPVVEAPIEEPAPAPIVEEPVIEKKEEPAPVNKAEEEDLASIAKSLYEINKTLKAMLMILNK